jgi:hypothetical protein
MEINRVDAAAKMFGVGSKQHKAAIKKFGPSGGPSSQTLNLKKSAGAKSVKGTKSGGRGKSQPRDRKGRWK